jgi:hypothetical protein
MNAIVAKSKQLDRRRAESIRRGRRGPHEDIYDSIEKGELAQRRNRVVDELQEVVKRIQTAQNKRQTLALAATMRHRLPRELRDMVYTYLWEDEDMQ